VLTGNLKTFKVLGADGFGITHLAHDSILEADVVIKEYYREAWALRDAQG